MSELTLAYTQWKSAMSEYRRAFGTDRKEGAKQKVEVAFYKMFAALETSSPEDDVWKEIIRDEKRQ